MTTLLGGHIRIFITWIRLTVRTTAFRSYTTLLSFFLRLIRHCQVVGKNERAFREPGLALSSHPTERDKDAPRTLAVPEALPQSESSNGVASNTRPLETSSASLTQRSSMNSSKPDIHHVNTAPPDPAATEQFFHITTPIIPGQIKRSGSKKTQGLDIVVYEVPTGPLDCSKEFAPVPGWEPLTHPEGALFFYHSNRKVFTYANIQGPGTAVEMDEIAKKAYEEAHKANVFRSSVELALERMVVGED